MRIVRDQSQVQSTQDSEDWLSAWLAEDEPDEIALSSSLSTLASPSQTPSSPVLMVILKSFCPLRNPSSLLLCKPPVHLSLQWSWIRCFTKGGFGFITSLLSWHQQVSPSYKGSLILDRWCKIQDARISTSQSFASGIHLLIATDYAGQGPSLHWRHFLRCACPDWQGDLNLRIIITFPVLASIAIWSNRGAVFLLHKFQSSFATWAGQTHKCSLPFTWVPVELCHLNWTNTCVVYHWHEFQSSLVTWVGRELDPWMCPRFRFPYQWHQNHVLSYSQSWVDYAKTPSVAVSMYNSKDDSMLPCRTLSVWQVLRSGRKEDWSAQTSVFVLRWLLLAWPGVKLCSSPSSYCWVCSAKKLFFFFTQTAPLWKCKRTNFASTKHDLSIHDDASWLSFRWKCNLFEERLCCAVRGPSRNIVLNITRHWLLAFDDAF